MTIDEQIKANNDAYRSFVNDNSRLDKLYQEKQTAEFIDDILEPYRESDADNSTEDSANVLRHDADSQIRPSS